MDEFLEVSVGAVARSDGTAEIDARVRALEAQRRGQEPEGSLEYSFMQSEQNESEDVRRQGMRGTVPDRTPRKEWRRDRGDNLPAALNVDELSGTALTVRILDWVREAHGYREHMRSNYDEAPPPERFLISKLRDRLQGTARAWADAQWHRCATVADFLHALQEEYEATAEVEAQLWEDLRSRRMANNDLAKFLRDFDAEFARIARISSHAPEVGMEKARERLMQAIPRDCRTELRHTIGRNGALETLPYGAILQALKLYAKSRDNTRRDTDPRRHARLPLRRSDVQRFVTAIGANARHSPAPRPAGGGPFTGNCWLCQKPGHRASQCPTANRASQQLTSILAGAMDDDFEDDAARDSPDDDDEQDDDAAEDAADQNDTSSTDDDDDDDDTDA